MLLAQLSTIAMDVKTRVAVSAVDSMDSGLPCPLSAFEKGCVVW